MNQSVRTEAEEGLWWMSYLCHLHSGHRKIFIDCLQSPCIEGKSIATGSFLLQGQGVEIRGEVSEYLARLRNYKQTFRLERRKLQEKA